MPRPALVPELYVSNLDASLSFYVDLLGFHVAYDRPEDRFACLALGPAYLMLEQAPALARATAEQFHRGEWRTADLERPFGRGINLEIRVSDIEAIGARLERARYPTLLDLHARVYRVEGKPYPVRQLLVADPDGYLIRFSEPSAAPARGVSWEELESAAPELARFGRERLHGEVAYLASVRADRLPRLHPVTPIVGGGRLYLFMEPTSPKGRDLERGSAYALHASVRDNEGSNGEFLVLGFGRRCEDPSTRRHAESVASYEIRPRYVLFELSVVEASATTYTEAGPTRAHWKPETAHS